ncbi:Cerato-platanin [Cristinia sonorae]|uniref:Cerato-platanin n=1 Tax=Cristinia sonorae TaxID=1940300 RepID=A0A8K0XPS7_9AGAR|nr:Cerato-platanin [Cristinia sonorae]
MQFTNMFAMMTLFVASALATTVSFDNTYDNGPESLNNVACSDGSNGLIIKGFSTFNSLPSFPNIAGASVVASWNDAHCGTCWELTYAGTGRSINVLVVDHTDEGFNLSQEAMDTLTNNQAQALGRIDADVKQVDASACGL